MAVLTTEERKQVHNGLMRHWSRLREVVAGLTKADLLAAIDATDDWINSNATSYNNALPTAAKNNLTATQKTLLFCAVAARRAGLAFAKQILGGDVD